jgi:hypothetical protein
MTAIPADDIAELAPGQEQKTVNVTVKRSSGTISEPWAFTISPGAPVVVDIAPMPLPRGINDDPVIDGDVPNIHFEGWIWYQDAQNQTAIYFDSPNPTSDNFSLRTFTFVNGPRILESMGLRYFDPGSPVPPIEITVTNEKDEPASLSIQVGQSDTLNTNWVKCSKTVTVKLDPATYNIGIVKLTYLGSL